MTPAPPRSLVRRVLWHPLLWAAVCFAGALPLLGTEHDFWGFLLALIAGWAVAHAVVRTLFLLRPAAVSVAVHLGLSAGAGLALIAIAQPGEWPIAVPPAVRTGISFASITFSGWIWLTLLGRATAAVEASSARRAALLVEPEWRRDGDAWALRLPVVALRRATYLAAGAVLAGLAAAAMAVFVLVFADLAQRLGPMAILLLLGWTVGYPVFLVVAAIARSGTVEVDLRLGSEGIRVVRTDGVTLMDVGLDGIRGLLWAARSSPTRVVLRPDAGAGLVLLVGMARRPRGAAPTLPDLPGRLVRVLEDAGLTATAARRAREGELNLERATPRIMAG